MAWEKLKRLDPHAMNRPAGALVEPFPEQGRIALLGDWGTGLYGAPVIAKSARDDPDSFAMLMHLRGANHASGQIPGAGPALATALVASVADPRAFRSGRNFPAWAGLVPKQHSSGAKIGSAVSATKAIVSAQPVYGRRARRHPLCQDP